MRSEQQRQRTREALLRHATMDPHATEREKIGAQVGLLCMIGVIVLVGVFPMESSIRIPFMTVGFMTAFYIAVSVKRWLDERHNR